MTSPRQMTDRLLRESLRMRENLRDFLESALPKDVANMDFTKVEELSPELFTGDWHEREADLFFEVAYNIASRTVPAVVGILIEHSSDTETTAPLRALCNVTAFWERHWRKWEQSKSPRGKFTLPPAFSVVLYTGDGAWGGKKKIRELLDEPESFHPFAPDWGPIFWNLADRTADELLAGGPWMQLMAVMRVWPDEQKEYMRVLTEAFRHVQQLGASDHVRWSRLTHGLLTYSIFRRPPGEHAQIREIGERENPERIEEVKAMSKTIAEALEEQGEQRGELKRARTLLRKMLEKHIGPIPEAIQQRIDAENDVERISAAVLGAEQLKSFDEFQL